MITSPRPATVELVLAILCLAAACAIFGLMVLFLLGRPDHHQYEVPKGGGDQVVITP